jgi:hypothetical protein
MSSDARHLAAALLGHELLHAAMADRLQIRIVLRAQRPPLAWLCISDPLHRTCFGEW